MSNSYVLNPRICWLQAKAELLLLFRLLGRVRAAWQLILQSVRGSPKTYSFAWYCLKFHVRQLQMRDY